MPDPVTVLLCLLSACGGALVGIAVTWRAFAEVHRAHVAELDANYVLVEYMLDALDDLLNATEQTGRAWPEKNAQDVMELAERHLLRRNHQERESA